MQRRQIREREWVIRENYIALGWLKMDTFFEPTPHVAFVCLKVLLRDKKLKNCCITVCIKDARTWNKTCVTLRYNIRGYIFAFKEGCAKESLIRYIDTYKYFTQNDCLWLNTTWLYLLIRLLSNRNIALSTWMLHIWLKRGYIYLNFWWLITAWLYPFKFLLPDHNTAVSTWIVNIRSQRSLMKWQSNRWILLNCKRV